MKKEEEEKEAKVKQETTSEPQEAQKEPAAEVPKSDPIESVPDKEEEPSAPVADPSAENAEDEAMPLPQYFQNLYEEFSELEGFDLKEVIYDKKTQEAFMEAVREELVKKQAVTPLQKKELWKVIRESKFPIMLGALVTIEGFIEGCAGALQLSTISFLRTGIYIKMTQEGLKRGADVVKNEKIQRQYREVADELQSLKSIICSVAEYQNEQQRIKE